MAMPAYYLARPRQVPMSWKRVFPAPPSAVLYGLTLGFGFASTVHSWSFYGVVAGILFTGRLDVGLVAGAAFGVGRALPVLVSPAVSGGPALDELAEGASTWVQLHARTLRVASACSTALAAWVIDVWA